jgi:hypothetical protein
MKRRVWGELTAISILMKFLVVVGIFDVSIRAGSSA